MLDLQEDERGVSFRVRVSTRASRSAVTGLHGAALKVSLAAPPVEGEANRELCALIAERLGVPARAVSIVHGERSKSKLVRVLGVNADAVNALLG